MLIKFTKTKRTCTFVLDNDDSTSTTAYRTGLSILLGGYNEFGREIPYDDYKKLKEQFNQVIYDMKVLYEKHQKQE